MLMAVVPSPGVMVAVAESLIRDLGRVSEWCDLWGMTLNASKTKTESLEVSHNASPVTPLTIGGTVLQEFGDLVILGVTFDSKITLEEFSLGFQSSFAKTWYLEVLASIP